MIVCVFAPVSFCSVYFSRVGACLVTVSTATCPFAIADFSPGAIATNGVVLYDAQAHQWLYFHQPVATFVAMHTDEVMPVLEAVQAAVDRQGYYAVGWLSYEAAPAFDPSFVVKAAADFPLAWFGVYPTPDRIHLPSLLSAPLITPEWTATIAPADYQHAFAEIKHQIAQGNTYQVNFSLRLRSRFTADPWAYFQQLIQAQNCHYGAFANLDEWAICCASPELFFQLDERIITCRPMKGTARRGLSYADDRQMAETLRHSLKNQAENVMIVDMIRNDLGRIARRGTVQVTELFAIEQYPTLWQMTSTVQALTDASWVEILRSLFPCASITGAPKTRTMQIIADLEDSPRRIYTGTIGMLAPHRIAQFNVAIRTVLIDKRQQQAEYGTGGGIVWDSEGNSEWQECGTKTQILQPPYPTFELLESLRWDPEAGYFLLDLHLERLQQSARYFDFSLNLAQVREYLDALTRSLPPKPHKIRLRVARSGVMQGETECLNEQGDPPLRVGWATTPINSEDVFLYHKTTRRDLYETAYATARQTHPDWDDVLLWNERGEVTESCFANLVVVREGQWYTPPVSSGLLAGTFRAWLLQQGKVQEHVLYRDDLDHCTGIYLVNSVRGMRPVLMATIVRETPHPKNQNYQDQH